MTEISIYGLHDPDSKTLEYIGQSVDTRARLGKHILEAQSRQSECPKDIWIRGLLEKGLRPVLSILGTAANKRDANALEHELIAGENEKGRVLKNSVYFEPGTSRTAQCMVSLPTYERVEKFAVARGVSISCAINTILGYYFERYDATN